MSTTQQDIICFRDNPNVNEILTGGNGVDYFVINGNSSDYQWGPTEDGKGIVVWNGDCFDILFNFEAIKFNDKLVELDGSNGGGGSTKPTAYHDDVANETQHLTGSDDKTDVFRIDGNSSDYQWGPTEDGKGIVVWNDHCFDILNDFQAIKFNDKQVELDSSNGGGGNTKPTAYHDDVANETQHLTGSDDKTDVFRIDGNSSDYQWGATEDGKGIVVWNDHCFDILNDFEAIKFNDTEVTLDMAG